MEDALQLCPHIGLTKINMRGGAWWSSGRSWVGRPRVRKVRVDIWQVDHAEQLSPHIRITKINTRHATVAGRQKWAGLRGTTPTSIFVHASGASYEPAKFRLFQNWSFSAACGSLTSQKRYLRNGLIRRVFTRAIQISYLKWA